MTNGRPGAKKGARTYSERKSDGDGEKYNSITKSEMQDIVKNAVDDALKAALDKLTSTVEKNINEAVSTLKSEMNIISNENDKMKKEINILKVKIDNQATHLDYALNEAKTYKSMWKESMIWCNNIEQCGRRWSLRIHGHPQKDQNEGCKKEVVDIIKTKLHINEISVSDIDAAHRIERKHKDGPQAINVKIFRRALKQRDNRHVEH